MFNLANNLTLLRIGAVPIIVVLLYFPGPWTTFTAALVFTLAALTDILDGMVARRQNLITNMGKFLDPLADKLLVCATLVMLVRLDWVPAWVAIVIISRELIVTGLRAMAADKGMIIAADTYGKIKTILQLVALGPLVLHYPLLGMELTGIATVILYLAVIMTIFSGGNYLYNFYRNWLEQR